MPAHITTAALREPSPAGKACPVPALDIFRERCEARAILVEACLFDLQDAVDGLQAAAVASGLVADIGQDAVQRMMAEAFAIMPRAGPLEADLEAIADCLETMPRPRPGVAASTLAAADYLIQQNDPAQFKAWLARHSRGERAAIFKHIHGAKP